MKIKAQTKRKKNETTGKAKQAEPFLHFITFSSVLALVELSSSSSSSRRADNLTGFFEGFLVVI